MATAVAALTHAQTGSFNLSDSGSPSSSPGILTGATTTWNVGDLITGGVLSGFFASLPAQNFGAQTFVLGNTSGSFGNAVFGFFNYTNVSVIYDVPNIAEGIRLVGTYNTGASSGSWDGGSPVTSSSSLDLNFGYNGTVSDSGSLQIPAVPEPGTWGLMGMGAVALGMHLRRRKA